MGTYNGPAPNSLSGFIKICEQMYANEIYVVNNYMSRYVGTPKGRVFVHSWPEPQFDNIEDAELLKVCTDYENFVFKHSK